MIKVFYHMYCLGDCIERLTKTFKKIKSSGLFDSVESFNINLTGDKSAEMFKKLVVEEPKVKLTNYFTDSRGEMDTLKLLWDTAQSSSSEDKYLYLHSKGVSRPGNENVQAWIDYMEYFVIEKWKDCISSLENFDTCGVNLQPLPMKHYSGNFWWATTNYLKRIKRFDPQNSSYIKDPRVYCELWLLDNNFCKTDCLFSSNVDHYSIKYEEHKYKTN